MYFGGGLIPTYFLIRTLGITNTFWVYIIPFLVNIWNMILMRSYFQSVPDALEESARIDGANYFTVFFKIYWPVSTPIIATISLYFAVQHWNDWYTTFVYIRNPNLRPMTNVLLSIINEAKFAEQMAALGVTDIGNAMMGKMTNVRSVTMATMIVSIIPIIVIYPFLQRFFIKGIMIGSIKG
jgi:putative aldouronate transport system permease protein